MAPLADLLTSKTPPQNLEAERAVLGALLLEPGAWPRILERLTAEHFYKEAHRTLFATMISVQQAGSPIDLVTVADALRQRAELDEIGGAPYLALLVSEAAILHNLDSYAALVRDKAALRELIRAGTELIGRAYDNGQPAEVLAAASAKALDTIARQRGARPAFHALAALLAAPPPKPVWLVEGLALQSANGWIGAGAKVGKSLLVLDLLLAGALGAPWLDTFAVARPLSVVFVEEEDSAWRVYERATRLLRGRGLDAAPPAFQLAVRTGVQLDQEPSLGPLLDCLHTEPVDLIVWDVFNRLHTLDEKRPDQMLPLLKRVDRLRDEFGCANLILHHTRKPGVAGPDLASGGQQLRGPSEFWGWAENSLYLKPLKTKGSLIIEPESKDALVAPFKVHLEDLSEEARRWVYDGPVAAKVSEGDQTRAAILEALALNPMTAAQLIDHCHKPERTVKRHLSALQGDGAVESIREPGRAGQRLWMLISKAEEVPF